MNLGTRLSKCVCVCMSKREREREPYFYFFAAYQQFSPTSEGPTVSSQLPPYHIIVPVIIVVVVVVFLSIILIAYLRYLRLKAEPPRMCPVESVTASLIASTLAPLGLQPVENNNFEFSRENLQFLKVLGEYR